MKNRTRSFSQVMDFEWIAVIIELSWPIFMATLIMMGAIVPNSTWAKSSKSSDVNSYQASVIKPKVSVLKKAKTNACFRIDKNTGQVIPCDEPSKTGGYFPKQEEDQVEDTPKAFDYFNADYSENDFHNDQESVIPNAYLLSQLSAIAYLEPGGGENQVGGLAKNLGLNVQEPIADHFSSFLDIGGVGGESKAYIFYNEDSVFIAFEGSTGWLDWEESNLDFWAHAKPEWGQTEHQICYLVGCQTFYTDIVSLHNGFYDATDIIFDDVLEAILPLLATRKLWITGHSLGGAVATITAFRLEFDHDISVQGVHVFGAPAVGDSDWENVFENTMSNVHRWNLEGDPAPIATQAPMFYHVGIINNLYSDDTILLDAPDSEMLGYIPHCGFAYGVNVTHMNYWTRMHEELNHFFPDLVPLFPDSLPSPEDVCYQ